MLKDGVLKINPDNPHKELPLIIFRDNHHCKYIGQVSPLTNLPDGLGLAVKIDKDYQPGDLVEGMFDYTNEENEKP